jgi:sulfane dehydrogenase subunit SoxC
MDEKRSRRGFLKNSAALATGLTVGAVRPADAQTAAPEPHAKDIKELIAYGERSRFVTSLRVPVSERMSPDMFGLTFHVLTPLQDSVGIITPSSLFYTATHRGAFVPDIDPREHRLMIHGMVDRPLTFTMDELKRLPYITRVFFVECAGNRAQVRHKTVQETHGLTSCAEWVGVPLSLLLKEAGVQNGASWIVAEGAEEVKGGSSLPIAKAMDDCLVAYAMNGEPLRPQQGFPLRLIVPGFEGIHQIKYLRRIKLVDRYYMTYDDYGHINSDPKAAALALQIGPKSVITFPSGGQQLSGPGFYEISGLAWSGAVPFARWRSPPTAVRSGRTPSFGRRPIEWRTPGLALTGSGTEKSACSCRAVPTNWGRFNPREPRSENSGMIRPTGRASAATTTPFNRGR